MEEYPVKSSVILGRSQAIGDRGVGNYIHWLSPATHVYMYKDIPCIFTYSIDIISNCTIISKSSIGVSCDPNVYIDAVK